MAKLCVAVIVVEYQKITVWSNSKCHDCAFENKLGCEKFGIHTRSDDFHCLFCINNPNAVLPIKNHYKSMEEIMKEALK